MESEAPSWADQWGKGGFGAMGDDNNNGNTEEKESGNSKKKVKSGTSAGLTKAKSVAVAGAQKVKSGTSTGFNWIKNKCQKKNSPSNE